MSSNCGIHEQQSEASLANCGMVAGLRLPARRGARVRSFVDFMGFSNCQVLTLSDPRMWLGTEGDQGPTDQGPRVDPSRSRLYPARIRCVIGGFDSMKRWNSAAESNRAAVFLIVFR